MTNQPTKRQFHLHRVDDLVCVTTKENSHLDLKEVVNLRWILAAFHGPDREANAALFIRAQHMDELVETMKPRLSKKARAELEQTAEAEENDGSAALADAIRFLLEQEDRRAAILAKIKGGM